MNINMNNRVLNVIFKIRKQSHEHFKGFAKVSATEGVVPSRALDLLRSNTKPDSPADWLHKAQENFNNQVKENDK